MKQQSLKLKHIEDKNELGIVLVFQSRTSEKEYRHVLTDKDLSWWNTVIGRLHKEHREAQS